MVEAVAEVLDGRARRGRRLRPRPPGRVGAGLGRRDRRAADAGRDVAGQALPGGARPARAGGHGGPDPEAQRPAARPVLLGRQARLAAGARRRPWRAPARPGRCGWARSTRSCATGSARASAPTRRPPRAPSSGRRTGTPSLLEIFGVPREALPEIADTAGDLGTLRHPSWPCELPLRARCPDQQAALAGAGCVEPGRTKATYGTGVFVLANVGTERPGRDGRPAADRRLAGRRERSSGRSTAACSPPARCSSGSSRDLGLAADPPALRRPRRRGRGRRRRARAAGARRARRAVVAARRARGDRRADRRARGRRTWRARRSRRSPGGWPTSSRWSRRARPVDVLRVDGGLTRDPLLLQLQADAARHSGRARRRRRDGHRRRRARRGRRRAVAGDVGDRRAHPDRGAGRAAARRRLAQRPRTPSGGASWSARRSSKRQAASARPTLSATQQGLSEPSTSTVNRVTTCHQPPPTSSTETTSAFARTRLPAGTGAGKRTLFQP